MTLIIDNPDSSAPAAPERTGMVWIPGGSFAMGAEDFYPEERPVRRASVEGFWIDARPVTNRDFAAFVEATGWVTSAETAPNAADYPDALPEQLVPASLVFTPTRGPVDLRDVSQWWRYMHGADWRHPYGPDSSLDGLLDHPVVHVAWRDVEAYATWAGAELPSEIEWEFAARGGLDGKPFAWGDALQPGDKPLANVWQGRFPFENFATDGWTRTSPVATYPPNGYGLYDMIGNVWEWTADWWSTHALRTDHCCALKDPRVASIDARDPCRIPRKVLKGGSHLCAPSYCRRYRPAARHAHPIDTSTSHIGFRCVVRRSS
jgi:formylglycine-generating enzyme required for sulfatase activity